MSHASLSPSDDNLKPKLRSRHDSARGTDIPLPLPWENPVEVVVATDPNPGDRVAFENTYGSIIAGDAGRPILRVVEESMEMKRGMKRIRREVAVGLTGFLSEWMAEAGDRASKNPAGRGIS
jgi:hypothetical protein